MRAETKEATAQDVVESNLLDQRFAEVFLLHPEQIPLVQVLTLHAESEGGGYRAMVINTRTHDSWMMTLQSQSSLVVYPWGSYR